MRFALIVVCLVGCARKSEQPAGAGSATGSAAAPAGPAGGSASTAAAGSDAGSAAAAPAGGSAEQPTIDAAVAAAPADAPAAVADVCCCESQGDVTHYTIEGDPAACTADDMNGTCVDLADCELETKPQILTTGTAVSIESAGLLAMWKTKEEKAFAAVEIKPAGANATVRTTGDNRPDAWTKRGSIPTAPGPLTLTAHADGTALLSNGKTTWVLAQEYRYGEITFKKRK